MKYIKGLMIMAIPFLLTGCGSYSDYATQVNNSNIQSMEIWKSAEKSRQVFQTNSLVAFSQAMNNAANTPDSGDDVAIAMAYAYNSQQKPVALPHMAKVERPNDFVDGLKATVPLLNSAVPWLSTAYMVDRGFSAAGDHYKISGDNTSFDSGNSGSYNTVGSAGDGLGLTGSSDNSYNPTDSLNTGDNRDNPGNNRDYTDDNSFNPKDSLNPSIPETEPEPIEPEPTEPIEPIEE